MNNRGEGSICCYSYAVPFKLTWIDANKVTLSGTLIALRWRQGDRWTNLMVRDLGLAAISQPQGKGEGLEIKSNLNGQWLNQLCLYNRMFMKTMNSEIWGTSRLILGGWCAQRGLPELCSSSHILWLMHLFIWLFICILDGNSVLVRKVFSWVLLAVIKPERGVMRTHNL